MAYAIASRISVIFLIALLIQGDATTECTVTGAEAEACVKGLPSIRAQARRPISPPILMQTRHEVAKSHVTLKSLDATVAKHIRKFGEDSANVAAVISEGVAGILTAATHFAAKRIGEGVSGLGQSLLGCIALLLPSDKNSGEAWTSFSSSWKASFANIPDSAASIKHDIQAYIIDGDPVSLVRAIVTIINEAGAIVSLWLPSETAMEVLKYLLAITDSFEAIGGSWDAFARGETVEGIEGVYSGIRTALDSVLPAHLRDDNTYNSIITTLDGVVGSLSETVLAYERRLMESMVCWRKTTPRNRMRPSTCVQGYIWDGQQYCYPSASLIAESSSNLDSTLQNKNKPGRNAIPAQCDADGAYTDKLNHWCYQMCPYGFIEQESKCKSACIGNFSAETPGMCGRDQGMITKATMEMVTVVMNSAFQLAANIGKMREKGVDPTTLTATVQVFIDLGKPFANPICPTGLSDATAVEDSNPGSAEDSNPGSAEDALPTPQPPAPQSPSRDPLVNGHVVALHSDVQNSFVRMNSKDVDGAPGSLNGLTDSMTWERFLVVDAGGGEVALHNAVHNRFIKMSSSGKVTRSAKRSASDLPSRWDMERFQVVDAGVGTIAFFNRKHRRFLRMAANGLEGGPKISGSLPTQFGSERFHVVDLFKA